jgi:hypothetical protein
MPDKYTVSEQQGRSPGRRPDEACGSDLQLERAFGQTGQCIRMIIILCSKA